MNLNVNDSGNDTVTRILKSLPQVNAPVNFEDNLWRRINAETFELKYKKETWWEKFLSPGKLIPSAGLALATVILLFVFNLSGTENENPLVATPKLRSDIANVAPQVNQVVPHKPVVIDQTTGSLSPSTFTASINKSGYNFLQVRLSAMEKERIDRLRERIRGYFNQNGK